MLYAGYGLLGGLGFAFGYISPVANLLRWFPDKKGVATGLGVSFFGGGALLCAPLAQNLFEKYQKLPDYLGDVNAVDIATQHGKRLVEVGNEMKEVIVATKDMVNTFPGVVENGVYVVGTGDTGVGPTFLTLSAMYTTAMVCTVLRYHRIDMPLLLINAGHLSCSCSTNTNNVMQLWLTHFLSPPPAVFCSRCLGRLHNAVRGKVTTR